MWAEILSAHLKPGWKDADLDRVIRWNSEYHRKEGLDSVRYFLSESRDRFVMIVEYEDRDQMLGLRAKWEASGQEGTEPFVSMMAAVFDQGSSAMYVELQGLGGPEAIR